MTQESWYYWTDPEVCRGPHASREEAIEAGREEYPDGEPFEIAKGWPMKYSAPGFDMVAEWFDDANREYSGDEYASAKWTREHIDELKRELAETFDRWLDRHGYRQAWALDLGPSETIPATEEYTIWLEAALRNRAPLP